MPGIFVTGTDTGAGKTVLAASLVAALAAQGRAVAAHKPVVTGEEHHDPLWPADHELLGSLCGLPGQVVAPLRFGLPASPHLAAQLSGHAIDPAALLAAARAAVAAAETIVVEGVGGLLVPFTPTFSVRDLALELGLGVIVAARPTLGTINHTLLTLEAARSAGLDVRAVVLTPWPEQPDTIERSNAETIAALGRVDVATLPHLARPEPALLAAAGASLPYERWLA